MPYPMPSGVLFVIAEDGTHHVLAKTAGGNFVQIAAAETLTATATIISTATWRADVASQLGVTDDIPAGGSGVVTPVFRIGCPGTSKFIVLGQNFNTPAATYQITGIRYSIVSEGVTAIDGNYHYYQGGGGFLSGSHGGALGQVVIGSNVYFVAEFLFDGMQLVVLPINVSEVTLTADSWNQKRFELPGDMADPAWWTPVSRDPKNLATLFAHEDGTGILGYRTTFEGEAASTLFFTVVDSGGAYSGLDDISATFGIPFSDEGFDFAGLASINGDDWYTCPSINVLDDGRLEFMFLRGYSDHDGWIGVRRFICDPDLTNVETFSLAKIQITTVVGITLEAVHGYREDGDIIWMIREDAALTFKTTSVPLIVVIAPTGKRTDVNIEGM